MFDKYKNTIQKRKTNIHGLNYYIYGNSEAKTSFYASIKTDVAIEARSSFIKSIYFILSLILCFCKIKSFTAIVFIPALISGLLYYFYDYFGIYKLSLQKLRFLYIYLFNYFLDKIVILFVSLYVYGNIDFLIYYMFGIALKWLLYFITYQLFHNHCIMVEAQNNFNIKKEFIDLENRVLNGKFGSPSNINSCFKCNFIKNIGDVSCPHCYLDRDLVYLNKMGLVSYESKITNYKIKVEDNSKVSSSNSNSILTCSTCGHYIYSFEDKCSFCNFKINRNQKKKDNLTHKCSNCGTYISGSEKVCPKCHCKFEEITIIDKYDSLLKIKELYDKGIITKTEFNDEKKRILYDENK